MKRISEYKALARASMKGSYGQGVGLMFAVVMAQSILSAIFTQMTGNSQIMAVAYNILNLIFAAIIFNPLLVGLSKFFLEQAQGRPDINNVFCAFKTNLTNTVKVAFIRDIKLVLWMLPALVILGVAGAFTGVDGVATVGATQYSSIMVWLPFAALVFMIPGIVKSMEYTAINYILAENPDIKSKDAFKMARQMMQGNKRRLFLLQLSFMGWILLGMMAFFAGIFFVMPYIEAAVTQFYLDVKAQAAYDEPAAEKTEYEKFDDGDTFGI